MGRPVKTPQLVSWHENPSSGLVKGLVTLHVKQPYYVEIAQTGEWALLTLGKDDKPKFVDSGTARNVTKAKAAVNASILSKIPEVKAVLAESTSDVIETKARVIEPQPISTQHATLRWYGKVTALVLWFAFLSYWWIRFQPRAATLSLVTLGVGVWTAHQIRRVLTHEGEKLEKIHKRKQAQQARQIAQQNAPQVRQIRQAPPTRKALPRR